MLKLGPEGASSVAPKRVDLSLALTDKISGLLKTWSILLNLLNITYPTPPTPSSPFSLKWWLMGWAEPHRLYKPQLSPTGHLSSSFWIRKSSRSHNGNWIFRFAGHLRRREKPHKHQNTDDNIQDSVNRLQPGPWKTPLDPTRTGCATKFTAVHIIRRARCLYFGVSAQNN